MENDFGIDYYLNLRNQGRPTPDDYLPPRPEKCLWKIVDYDGYVATYSTECGKLEYIKADECVDMPMRPEPQGMYCHHCGGRLHINSTLKRRTH